ncbi:MAG: periplasmic heavy metal sensor [bacterium]
METKRVPFAHGRNAKATALALIILLVGALSGGASLWAQTSAPPAAPPPVSGPEVGPGQGPGPGPRGWCMKGLNLTQEQVNKMQSLRLEFSKQTADLDSQIHKKRLDLATLLRDPQAKEDAIGAAQKELNRMMAQRDEKADAYLLKARSLLTAEQIRNLPPGCAFGFWGGGMRGHGGGGCGPGMKGCGMCGMEGPRGPGGPGCPRAM